MKSKNISKEIIVAETVKMINENERPEISIHELARRLDIKPPSLYNHIKNTKDLRHEVFKYAIDQFVNNQNAAVLGKTKDAAVIAFSRAYYQFAKKNKGLYQLIMSMPLNGDEYEKEIAIPLLKSVIDVLKSYGLDDETNAIWQRVLRSILHGFIAQEELGYFYYYKDTESQRSRDIAIQCFLDGINKQVNKRKK